MASSAKQCTRANLPFGEIPFGTVNNNLAVVTILEGAMPSIHAGKRDIETIDLTGDDMPTSITSSQHFPGNGPSQLTRDSWVEQDEHDAEDIVISSQDGDDSVTATYQLYSILQTKIVGVQYYRGYASDGEHVIVRREPSNPVSKPDYRKSPFANDIGSTIPTPCASTTSSASRSVISQEQWPANWQNTWTAGLSSSKARSLDA